MSPLGGALYERDGDLVVPSPLTEGPWSREAQHGGAPAALMGGEIDRILSQSGLSLARLTIDFFRPVPLEPMTLSTTISRGGRRVQVIDATLAQDDRVVARASGLGFQTADHEIPFGIPEPELWPDPPDTPPVNYFERPGAFATDAMEVRMAQGDFNQPGPGVGWFRLLVPVLETDPTPVETTCAAADFANGVSIWEPNFTWLFINSELSIHFARPPSGEWVLLDSLTVAFGSGAGFSESRLFDETGRFGRSAQSLLVEPFEGR